MKLDFYSTSGLNQNFDDSCSLTIESENWRSVQSVLVRVLRDMLSALVRVLRDRQFNDPYTY